MRIKTFPSHEIWSSFCRSIKSISPDHVRKQQVLPITWQYIDSFLTWFHNRNSSPNPAYFQFYFPVKHTHLVLTGQNPSYFEWSPKVFSGVLRQEKQADKWVIKTERDSLGEEKWQRKGVKTLAKFTTTLNSQRCAQLMSVSQDVAWQYSFYLLQF